METEQAVKRLRWYLAHKRAAWNGDHSEKVTVWSKKGAAFDKVWDCLAALSAPDRHPSYVAWPKARYDDQTQDERMTWTDIAPEFISLVKGK